VVDLVVISGLALVLGELALRHRVLLSATAWDWIAGLSAVAAVGLAIARYARWLQGLPATRRAVSEPS
jgi:hypothetical protein